MNLSDMTREREGQSRLEQAIGVAGLGIVSIDYRTNECTLDAAAAGMFALEPNIRIPRTSIHSRFHPDDCAELAQAIQRALDPKGDGWFAMDHRVIHPDGSVRWLSVKKIVRFDDLNNERRPVAALLVAMDVTASRTLEESLKSQNQQLTLLARVANELIIGRGAVSDFLETIFEDLAKTLGADMYFNYEPDGESSMRLCRWKGLTEDESNLFATMGYGELLCGRVAQYRRPVIVEDIASTNVEGSETVKAAGFGAYAGFPLLAGDRLLGTVAFITRDKKHFLPGELTTATTICSLVSATMERTRLASELRDQAQRFRTLLEATSAITWTCPADGLHVVPQQSWMAFSGQSASEMSGDGWVQAVHPEDREAAAKAWQEAVRQLLPYTHEHRLRRFDGQWRWMTVVGVPILDDVGNIIEWFGMCLDVTERKLAEQQLREADRKKDEFLATLSHELRNPLTPIRAGIDILKLTKDEATIETARALMERQIGQLIRLLDDLMDVSRIAQGKIFLRRSVFSVQQALENAIDVSRTLIEEKSHEVIVDFPDEAIVIEADFTRVSQVLANLLNNAAKYTDPSGQIHLSAAKTDDEIVVTVEDNGVGIPTSHLNTVFDLFTQVDSSLEKSQGGLGIGLNLTKQLVELHGGSVAVESAGLGKGSKFIVRLPYVEPAGHAPLNHHVEMTSHRAKRRILVVDDNADIVLVLAKMLTMMGHIVETASDGVGAAAVAESFRPEVIFLDIAMPKQNGFDACRRIRQAKWGHHVVIVALTGWGSAEHKRRMAEAGCDYHLTKPVSCVELTQLLDRLD